MGKLAKARELSGAERGLLLKVALLLPAVRLAVRFLPLKTAVALFSGRRPRGGNQAGAPSVSPERLADLVEAAARHHFLKPTCLEKALVFSGLLRQNGLETDLRIGTTKKDGKFEAHAWVESNGQVILGGPVERYSPLPSRKVATGLPNRQSQDGQECPSPLPSQLA